MDERYYELASQITERNTAAMIERVRNRQSLAPCGVCHYCSEPVYGDRVFCEPDTEQPELSCNLEYSRYIERKQNGG